MSSCNPALFSMCFGGNDQKGLDGGGQVTFSNPLSFTSCWFLGLSVSDPGVKGRNTRIVAYYLV